VAVNELVAALLLGSTDALVAGEQRVGGKALGLARLDRAGAKVPAWAVLPVDAFERHLRHAGLDELVRATLAAVTVDSVEAAGATLQRAVVEASFAPDLRAELERFVSGRGPVAVRSSVVGEDSKEHSFAGLFDSFLFVEGSDAVAEAVARCFASAFNPRALAYRLEREGALEPPSLAVVVQEAVEGEVSGVMFSSNPVSGRSDEAVISACYGLGEGIVSGLCDSDEFVVSHAGRELSASVADKDVQVVRDPAGGVRQAPVADELRGRRSLDEPTALELSRRGLELTETLGGPQDIEWTLAGGELVFLQARPITAQPAAAGPLGGRRIVWDNSNIQESFNGVTTPLTFSIAVRAYESVYEQTFRVLGVPERTLAEYRPVFRNMLGLVGGRVYYNINNWYRGLLLLPSFRTQKEDMEHMMGLEQPVDFVEDRELSLSEKLRRLPGLVRVGLRLALAFRRLDALVARFLASFSERTGSIDRAAVRELDLDALLALAGRLDTEVVDDWTTPIVNDIYVSTMSGKLRRLVERSAGEDSQEVVVGLLSGEDAIESTEPTKRLMQLAGLARADFELRHALAQGTPAAAFEALRSRSPEMRAAIDDYLDRYGDRCMGEMKLETLSLRQDPSFIVQVLRNYVERPELSPEELGARERSRREALEREVSASLSWWGRRRLRGALRRARRGVKARENMRFSRTRLVGLLRDIYLAAGERLHEAGQLDAPRDVLYLTSAELTAYHDGTAVSTDLAGLARARKAEFAVFEGMDLPNHFETLGSAYHGRRVVPQSGGPVEAGGPVLHGTGCSPGVVESELAVIMSPDDDLAVNGKILTTVRTDPGWTPLFPSAAGLLIERGSTLSHSAVLAREFGIPAVVGVPGLMASVRDGERVRLDGGAGVVERLDER
jgi:phosphohistidine swiveling domain-containing protein